MITPDNTQLPDQDAQELTDENLEEASSGGALLLASNDPDGDVLTKGVAVNGGDLWPVGNGGNPLCQER